MERQEIIEGLRKKLFAAINKDDFQKVKERIEEAENERVKNEVLNDEKYGMKPMHSATNIGNLKILQFLLDNGADVNATNSTGYFSTPLHIAAVNDKLEIAQFLLDCDANINATNYKGFTPLYFASYYCHLGMVELLLCNGADASIQSEYGKTALDVAGGYRKDICNSNSEMQEIESVLSSATKVDCEAILTPIRANLTVALGAGDTTNVTSSTVKPSLAPIRTNLEIAEADDTIDMTSSAVRPSSFINSTFSWVGASTTAALGQSTPALPPAQQPVTYSTGSSISSSQVDFSGIALLADVVVRRFTGERYSRLLDDSLLTLEEIKERKLNAIERDLNIAMSKFDQFPESSLNNATISKVIDHQKFF